MIPDRVTFGTVFVVAVATLLVGQIDERQRPALETATGDAVQESEPDQRPAQRNSTGGFSRGGRNSGRYGRNGGTPAFDRSQYPSWQNDPNFRQDVFTFARLQYDGSGNTPDARWNNDFPDADLNLSFRLQQLTSLHVNPDGAVVRLDDPKLFEYPFLFMIGVTGLNLSETDAKTLREYLLSGGFLMVDDFWTPSEWRHIRAEMKKVFPESEAEELPPEHPVFHLIYDLKGVPRVPSIRAWQQGHTFEYWHGDPEGDEAPHFMAYFDGQGRMVALMCHNNDICDGWEREGENKEYFQLFSERWSYPLGINIIVYALTH